MLKIANRVKETTTTTGTGTYELGGAAAGFQTFVAGIGNGNACYYMVQSGSSWEVNRGVVTDASPDTLTRGTLIASSTGSAINWGSGAKDVFVFLPPTAMNGFIIDSDVAAADASIDFALTGDYEWYELRFRNLRMTTDAANLLFRISISSSFLSANYQSDILDATNSAAAVTSGTGGSSIQLAPGVDNSNAARMISGRLRIEDPANTTFHKQITGIVRSFRSSTGVWRTDYIAGGYIGGTGAIDAIRVLPSTSTIAVGDFALIGGHN